MSLQEGLELEGVLVLPSNNQMWELAKLLRLNKIVSVNKYWLNKRDFNISPLEKDSKKIIRFLFLAWLKSFWWSKTWMREKIKYLSLLVYRIIFPKKGKNKGRIRNTITHLICKMFCLIIKPPRDLPSEPWHPSLAGKIIQVDSERGVGILCF